VFLKASVNGPVNSFFHLRSGKESIKIPVSGIVEKLLPFNSEMVKSNILFCYGCDSFLIS
jgi:hypothetical protein